MKTNSCDRNPGGPICDRHPGSPISDRHPGSPVSDSLMAQVLGLHQTGLHRLVRPYTLHQAPPIRALSPTNSCTPNSRLTTLAVTSTSISDDRAYVLPSLNPLELGSSGVTTGTAVETPLAVCELTPELNQEIVSMLRMQLKAKQHNVFESGNRCYDQVEGYADADIVDAVRAVVGHKGREQLLLNFPSDSWLAMFKRDNGFLDVSGVSSRTSSRKCLTLPTQHHELYHLNYDAMEQQRLGDHMRWAQNRSSRQPAAPPPLSPLQRSPIQYKWFVQDEADGMNKEPDCSELYQPSRFDPPQHLSSEEIKFSQSPERCNSSHRKYRKSYLVPAKVWEAAMEDVAIHGLSLRNAAKANGVHFAALHRRLKKRQQHRFNRPWDPNYIPFEDEAGVVRVIHAHAEMGVLLTFTELMDLLKRTALKHRSTLPDDVAQALVCRFQSRVEQSVRHLVVGWPDSPNNILCLPRDNGGREGVSCILATGDASINVSESQSNANGCSEGASIFSSGLPMSFSSHPQSVAEVSNVFNKSPKYSTSRLARSHAMADKKITVDNFNTPVAIVSPSSDDSKTASS